MQETLQSMLSVSPYTAINTSLWWSGCQHVKCIWSIHSNFAKQSAFSGSEQHCTVSFHRTCHTATSILEAHENVSSLPLFYPGHLTHTSVQMHPSSQLHIIQFPLPPLLSAHHTSPTGSHFPLFHLLNIPLFFGSTLSDSIISSLLVSGNLK